MEDLDLEKIIVYHLLVKPNYFNTVYSFLNEGHFRRVETNIIYESIKKYFTKYETSPSIKELAIFINGDGSINSDIKTNALKYIKHQLMTSTNIDNYDFLIDQTKDYLTKMSLQDAILESVELIKKDGDFSLIVAKIEDALRYNFDKDLGSEFLESARERFEIYKRKFDSVSTGIDALDGILGGGLRPKTLTVLAGFSHSGKSSIMTSIMCGMAREKTNVLYVTLEMPESDILKKVDSNLMNISSNSFENLDEKVYMDNINRIGPNIGKVFVKEFAAGDLDVLKLKNLVDEIEKENKLTIGAVFVDYIGLMASTRVPLSVGLYGFYKAISEELHAFAKKYDKIVVTASQLNRSSANNLDAGMEAISDSLGVVMTADIFINILTNDELKTNKQVLLKFEKNRYTGELNKLLCNVNFQTVRLSAVDGDQKVPEIKGDFEELDGMNEAVNFSYDDSNFNFDNIKTTEDDFNF
jgi:replicative DNA helicase